MDTLDKSSDSKREVPPLLQEVLRADVLVTKKFLNLAPRFTVFRSLKTHGKFLEWSCHGIVWLVCWLVFIYMFNTSDLSEMQVNMLIGLLLDIVVIGVAKAAVRRRRPSPTKGVMSTGPDKFSFPSGHMSRAALVFYFFTRLYPISIIFYPPLLAWVTALLFSRVLLERHYLLDVVSGVLIGLAEGVLLGMIWLSQDSCVSILSWITDEKRDGGEFHV